MTDNSPATPAVAPHAQTLPLHRILLLLIIAGAGLLRAWLTWPSVFADEYVAFVENDAWYHMRLVDALVEHFPWRLWHDPYLVHPGGEPVNAGPVFDWLIAAVALLLGGGSPSPRLIDVVGAGVPPVLGALTVWPVYVLGREFWSREAGLWAAFMVAVLPSQVLLRSMLGFTDHHCLETLLSTTLMACVVLALKRDGAASRRWAWAAGGVFGTYLLTWGGAVLFVGFIVVWAQVQLVTDAVRGADSRDVTRVAGPVLLVAAVMVAPWAGTRPYFAYQFAALVGGASAIWGMHAAQRVGRRLHWQPRQWIAAIAVIGGAAALVALVILGDDLSRLLSDASRVSPFRRGGFVSEARPLMRSDLWTPVPLWREFTTGLVLAMLGLGVWFQGHLDGPRAPWSTLLAVWTVTMVAATFGQVRFTYYLGVNVALLAGLACASVLAGVKTSRTGIALRTLAVVVAALLIAVPGVPRLLQQRAPVPALDSNWHEALHWLRSNTPEPFADAGAYLAPTPTGTAAYGVMAWWDYGYWITRVARRVPVSNPKQTGVAAAAAVLLAATPEKASQAMQEAGARYLVVNAQLQVAPTGTKHGYFGGMVLASGGNPLDFCEMHVRRDDATGTVGEPALFCYPEYYRTMAMRLYLFAGKAATPPGRVTVVASQPTRAGSVTVREVTGEWGFDTYEQAAAFLSRSGRTDVRIVSTTPAETCVPLEAVQGYRQVFRSLDREGDGFGPAAVQIFAFEPPARQGS